MSVNIDCCIRHSIKETSTVYNDCMWTFVTTNLHPMCWANSFYLATCRDYSKLLTVILVRSSVWLNQSLFWFWYWYFNSCPMQAYEDMKACHRQARISGISSFIIGNDYARKSDNNIWIYWGWDRASLSYQNQAFPWSSAWLDKFFQPWYKSITGSGATYVVLKLTKTFKKQSKYIPLACLGKFCTLHKLLHAFKSIHSHLTTERIQQSSHDNNMKCCSA